MEAVIDFDFLFLSPSIGSIFPPICISSTLLLKAMEVSLLGCLGYSSAGTNLYQCHTVIIQMVDEIENLHFCSILFIY